MTNIQNSNYNIIFSDIDDTLYTDIYMRQKIEETHNIIKKLSPIHIIFISARPDIWIIRYMTTKYLKKDFTIFSLLMGDIFSLFLYFIIYSIYLITSDKKILYMAQCIIGNVKIKKFISFMKKNYKNILSETEMNNIYFFGDNIQGDEIFASYLMHYVNNNYMIDNKLYKISCIVSIRNVNNYV